MRLKPCEVRATDKPWSAGGFDTALTREALTTSLPGSAGALTGESLPGVRTSNSPFFGRRAATASTARTSPARVFWRRQSPTSSASSASSTSSTSSTSSASADRCRHLRKTSKTPRTVGRERPSATEPTSVVLAFATTCGSTATMHPTNSQSLQLARLRRTHSRRGASFLLGAKAVD